MLLFATAISLFILFTLSIFQLLLIAGFPLGKFAWGGSHKILPKKLRIASTVSVIIYVAIAVFIASKANILTIIENNSILSIGVWVLFAYFLTGIVLNAISKSKYERLTMTPVCVILSGCLLVLATSS